MEGFCIWVIKIEGFCIWVIEMEGFCIWVIKIEGFCIWVIEMEGFCIWAIKIEGFYIWVINKIEGFGVPSESHSQSPSEHLGSQGGCYVSYRQHGCFFKLGRLFLQVSVEQEPYYLGPLILSTRAILRMNIERSYYGPY